MGGDERKSAVGKSKKDKKHSKSSKDQPKKKKHAKQGGKQAKRAILQDRACPCCKKHCPLTDAECSKGKAIRKKLLRDAGMA